MDRASQYSRQTLPTTICCVCGASIVANSVNTCARCLQSRHDVTAELERQIVIVQCKRCDKWQKDDATWTRCDMESKELLSFCLKRVRNLKKLRLVDAGFVWTEPHSKRVKIRLKVQSEVEKAVILQQSCVIEFIIQNKMCSDCHRTEASLTWDSVVQVRQAVPHKRTFLYLEQLILKHNAQDKALKIAPMPEGVDFFFPTKTDGLKFLSFLDMSVPIQYKQAEKLITADLKSNNSTYNFSFSVQIAPICKDDLVVLPMQTASHLGSISRLCICLNVGSVIRVIDPLTCRFCELTSKAYWQKSFPALVDSQRLITFVVLDVKRVKNDGAMAALAARERAKKIQYEIENGVAANEDVDVAGGEEDEDDDEQEVATSSQSSDRRKKRRKAQSKTYSSSARFSSKHALCEVEIARERDLGVNDDRFTIFSHLGYVLKPGDHAMGYDLTTINYNLMDGDSAEDLRKHTKLDLPDIVLVKKLYPREPRMERNWKLRSLAAEAPDKPGYGMGVKTDEGNDARDMELFMRDLEEDVEMRSKVNLYKSTAVMGKKTQVEGVAGVSVSKSSGVAALAATLTTGKKKSERRVRVNTDEAIAEAERGIAIDGKIDLEELLDDLDIGGDGDSDDDDEQGGDDESL